MKNEYFQDELKKAKNMTEEYRTKYIDGELERRSLNKERTKFQKSAEEYRNKYLATQEKLITYQREFQEIKNQLDRALTKLYKLKTDYNEGLWSKSEKSQKRRNKLLEELQTRYEANHRHEKECDKMSPDEFKEHMKTCPFNEEIDGLKDFCDTKLNKQIADTKHDNNLDPVIDSFKKLRSQMPMDIDDADFKRWYNERKNPSWLYMRAVRKEAKLEQIKRIIQDLKNCKYCRLCDFHLDPDWPMRQVEKKEYELSTFTKKIVEYFTVCMDTSPNGTDCKICNYHKSSHYIMFRDDPDYEDVKCIE